MQKRKTVIVLKAFLCFFCPLQAGFNFSSLQSSLCIGGDSNLIVTNDLTAKHGTVEVKKHDADRIWGDSNIIFQDGALKNDRVNSIISGVYDPTANDTVVLQGAPMAPHYLTSEIGVVPQKIMVKGGYNVIEGRPIFAYPIVFDGDTNTTLTIGIQNKLTQNIELNNGLLILSDDLALGDDTRILGDGVIALNKKTLHLPGAASEWPQNFLFRNAADIELHARTLLTGTWSFLGKSTLNGNGVVLDMTDGGRIVVKPNSQLRIDDIMIKGIGSDTGLGNFVFEDESSKLVLSSVNIELESDYSTTIGSIYVDGTSTVIVKEHLWTFDQQGSLTVDGVTLWSDEAGAVSPYPIGIAFGTPKAAHYTSVASGTIKSLIRDINVSFLEELVYSNSVAINNTYDLSVSNSNAIVNIYDLLEECCDGGGEDDDHIQPGGFLEFTFDQTLDGDGKNVTFAHWDEPQFRVAPGVTVTLRNIELMRINENTFSLGEGSKIIIEEGVLFELSEDIVWRGAPIELVGDSTVFTIRGSVGGIKRINFIGSCLFESPIVNIGSSTLLLENAEMSGLQYFTGPLRGRDYVGAVVGAIALGGNAIVNLDASTRMNFVAQGNNNELRLRQNNIALAGNLMFGDLPENELHIKFLLNDEGLVTPRVRFENEFAFITSERGWANLIFDDPYVQVYNETANSFVVSDRSFLQGNQLEILHFPIKQVSRNFIIAPGLELLTDLDNAIEQEFIRSPFLIGRSGEPITTALKAFGRFSHVPRQEDYTITYKPEEKYRWSSAEADFEIHHSAVKLSKAKNSLWLRGGAIREFGVSDNDPLIVTMSDGSTLRQGAKEVVVKVGDEIRVQGKKNQVVVTNRLVLNGTILLDKNADLTFVFDSDSTDPELFLNTPLTVPSQSRLKFKGNGRVLFADGFVLRLEDSECVVEDSAELFVQNAGTLNLLGRGTMLVDNKARVEVCSNSHFAIGGGGGDAIDLRVDRQGEIMVAGATLSFNCDAYGIDVKRRGQLTVARDGVLHLHASNNASRVTLASSGTLAIDEDGKFLIEKQLCPITWDTKYGKILSDGLFGLAQTDFIGRFLPLRVGPVVATAEELVTLYLNQRPDLEASTIFVDQNGVRRLRTKDGVVVELRDDDAIVRDNPKTGAVLCERNGELFAITSRGKRV